MTQPRRGRPPSPVRGPLFVTGGSGYLGSALAASAAAAGWPVVATYHSGPARLDGHGLEGVGWERLDLGSPGAVAEMIGRVRPSVVVHAAALHASSPCTFDRAANWRVNAEAAGPVAVSAVRAGARLIHVSSDAVHSGRAEPYTEDDPPEPVFPYGAAKAAAEAVVRSIDPAAAVVRTSLIVSSGRWPLSRHEYTALAMTRAGPAAGGPAGGGPTAGVLFTDEIRCPVAVDDLVTALLILASDGFAGVLNVAGTQAMSRHELGRLVARRHGLDPDLVPAGLAADRPERRPIEVRLDVRYASTALGLPLGPAGRDWQPDRRRPVGSSRG